MTVAEIGLSQCDHNVKLNVKLYSDSNNKTAKNVYENMTTTILNYYTGPKLKASCIQNASCLFVLASWYKS